MNWTEILKARIPNESLPVKFGSNSSVFGLGLMGNYRKKQQFETSLALMENGKLVNMRIWLKQLRATINATYNAVIQNAEKIETIPMSTVTATVAPLRNKANGMLSKAIVQLKRREGELAGTNYEDANARDRLSYSSVGNRLRSNLATLFTEVNEIFSEEMPRKLRRAIGAKETQMIMEGATDDPVARTINPKEVQQQKEGNKPEPPWPPLNFANDNEEVEFYIEGAALNRLKSQRANTADDFPWKSYKTRFNFNYTNLEAVSLPAGLTEDIQMSRKVRERIKRLTNNMQGSDIMDIVEERFLQDFKKNNFSDPPLMNLNMSQQDYVFGIQESDVPRMTIGKILKLEQRAVQLGENGNINVVYSITPAGTAPDKIMIEALEAYQELIGSIGNQTYYLSEEGTVATDRQAAELEPERERLTEAMQEETGGGFYPALESYLDSKDDSLSEYKYKITIINAERASDIERGFKIMLGTTLLFEFSYFISGSKNNPFRKIIDGILIEGVSGS